MLYICPVGWYNTVISMTDVKASQASLVKGRGTTEGGGGIRGTIYEFAGTLCEFVHSCRRIPRS